MKRKFTTLAASICIPALFLGTTSGWSSCDPGATSIARLPTLGGTVLQVNAMNAAGQLTGFSYLPGDSAAHAFLLSDGVTTDLSTLGVSFSQGTAINASGQVVGTSSLPGSFHMHAFLYSGGNSIDLGTLGGSFSTATAVNDAAQVAGYSYVTGDSAVEAFLYENGSMTALGTLGGNSSSALAINQSGKVVGDASTASFETHAFLYADGTMTDLGTLGGGYSSASSLNDANVVVGESAVASGNIHAFAYANGVMTDLGTLGGTFSIAYTVNNANQIIGIARTTNDEGLHGFLYSNGAMTDLGTLGGIYSDPRSINNLGQIVGLSFTADGRIRAFLHQNGGMIDLNTLLPPDSGWELLSAEFISDSGLIVGQGIYGGLFQWFALELGAGANDPPVAVAGVDQTVECHSQVTLDGSQSSDPNGDPLAYEWSENGVVLGTNATLTVSLDLGAHTVVLTVSDPCGLSSQASVVITVADTTAPVISSVTANPSVLSPPNRQIVPVTLNAVVTDNCDPALVTRITSVVCNEPSAAGDIQITGDLTVNLVAAKNSSGSERVYTITVQSTDASGNSTTATATVTVLKSNGNGGNKNK